MHIDCDNFYASVECLYNPSLRGKPLAVAGDVENRHGIILAKNYLAKKYGVQTGDPLWLAKQKCKGIVFTPPHYDQYIRYSRIAREIYNEYSDQVESFGLDENWIDVTGSRLGSGKEIADKLRERVKFELGITVFLLQLDQFSQIALKGCLVLLHLFFIGLELKEKVLA